MCKKFLIILSLTLFVAININLQAQGNFSVDYGDGLIIDRDLDGLTDEGEKQLYGTDLNVADSDGDGYEDGVEIMSGTSAREQSSFPGAPELLAEELTDETEIPWAWYSSRASGLVAFTLLYISIFLGLTIRLPFFRKIFSPIHALNIHAWISLQAVIVVFFHGVVLAFDKYLNLTLVDLFVPFASAYQSKLISFGIFSFYLMIILVATSYGRKYISPRIWRTAHFMNILLYAVVLIHVLNLGTDMKNPVVMNVFLWANAFLVFLMLINMQLRISDAIIRRRIKNSDAIA